MFDTRKIVGSVIAAALLAGGLAVAAPGQGKDAEPRSTSSPDNDATVPVKGSMEDGLGAFRQPRTAEDRLPAIAATEVRGLGPDSTRPSATVRAQATKAVELYLTPAAESVCLSLVGEAGATVSCVPREAIEQGSGDPSPSMVFTGCKLPPSDPTTPTCERALVYGVVPDGVQRVSLNSDAAQSSPSARVVDNSYVLDVPIGMESLDIKYE